MREYHALVERILSDGVRKENRTGVDTLSVFGDTRRYDLAEGFPLLTTKKVSWKNIVAELLWFMSGDPTIDFLHKHKCKFWDPWAKEDNTVPSAYGNFWRRFPVPHEQRMGVMHAATVDQLAWVIELLKTQPNTRRAVVSAWAPSNAHTSDLPPCHVLFVFNATGNTLNLHLTQRSADIALGVPYNIPSYALLLTLVARFVGMEPGTFVHTLVDAHIYTAKPDGSLAEYDHVPGLKTQLTREPRALPKLHLSKDINNLEDLPGLMELSTEELLKHFVLEGYNPHPALTFKVAV